MVKLVSLKALWLGKFEVEFEYHILSMAFCLILFIKGGLLLMGFKLNWGRRQVDLLSESIYAKPQKGLSKDQVCEFGIDST
jgi:hypothetical protein